MQINWMRIGANVLYAFAVAASAVQLSGGFDAVGIGFAAAMLTGLLAGARELKEQTDEGNGKPLLKSFMLF